ncbi:hypothetical protein FACS1894182_00370 [Bacteroidia bacterium]|nr:hypothetical protein FACS1894182_00370 [Bacteroidia bacterium]
MKKLVLFVAVAVAISLSACKKAAPVQDVQEEEVITVLDEPAAEESVEAAADSVTVVLEEAAAQ